MSYLVAAVEDKLHGVMTQLDADRLPEVSFVALASQILKSVTLGLVS